MTQCIRILYNFVSQTRATKVMIPDEKDPKRLEKSQRQPIEIQYILREQIMFGATLEQSQTIDCVFHFIEDRGLKYVQLLLYYTIDTSSEFQWVSALRSGKADSEIGHLLEMVAIYNKTIIWMLGYTFLFTHVTVGGHL